MNKHPLMKNNISRKDLDKVIKYLKQKDPMLTQHKNVRLFEKKWSNWLGVKYSVFVNSGSSANYISLKILREITKKTEIIVSPLNWVSDISSILLAGFKPIFLDINPHNLCLDVDQIKEKINSNTAAVLLTHILGFNGLNKKFISLIKKKKIFLIEDVCESHGATFKNKKLGTYGQISNFSFYYAHHITTIEGGMICTNDTNIYEMARMFRSHGMVREISNENYRNRLLKKYPDLNKNFVFEYPGFNMRNTEIGAIIGLSQINSLDKNNKIRNRNFKFFLNNLNSDLFITNFDTIGISNYALIVVLQKEYVHLKARLEKIMSKNKIEFRVGTACGGNHLRQPYLKKVIKKVSLKKFQNVEHMHFYGYYIGNYPSLDLNSIKKITKILNSIND